MARAESIDKAVEILRASTRGGLRALRALLVGPPGTGKLMVSMRYYERMAAHDAPTAGEEAALKSIYCHAPGLKRVEGQRPRRAPHHTVSTKGLLGAVVPGSGPGAIVRPVPGEVSLAHAGLLVLDDLPEFQRPTIDALAHALRDGEIVLRWRGDVLARLPAHPQAVIATANIGERVRALEFAKTLGLAVYEEP